MAALQGIAAEPAADAGLSDVELRRLAPKLGNLTLSDLSIDLPPEDGPEKAALPESRAPTRGLAPIGGRPGAGKVVDGKAVDGKAADARGPDVKAADPLAVTVSPRPTRRITLREAALAFGPPSDGVPSTTRLSLSGLALPADLIAGAPIVGVLPAYGYRDLDLDVLADATLDERRATSRCARSP